MPRSSPSLVLLFGNRPSVDCACYVSHFKLEFLSSCHRLETHIRRTDINYALEAASHDLNVYEGQLNSVSITTCLLTLAIFRWLCHLSPREDSNLFTYPSLTYSSGFGLTDGGRDYVAFNTRVYHFGCLFRAYFLKRIDQELILRIAEFLWDKGVRRDLDSLASRIELKPKGRYVHRVPVCYFFVLLLEHQTGRNCKRQGPSRHVRIPQLLQSHR